MFKGAEGNCVEIATEMNFFNLTSVITFTDIYTKIDHISLSGCICVLTNIDDIIFLGYITVFTSASTLTIVPFLLEFHPLQAYL